MSDVKNYPLNTQGYKLQVRGPATVEAFDAKAGSPGSCLEAAVENEIFRGTIPAFWDAFIPKVESLTGIKQQEDPKRTETARLRAKTPEAAAKVSILETPAAFDKRVRASVEDSVKLELDKLAEEVIATIEVDPSPSARAARGPGKELLQRADDILSRDSDGIEGAVEKIMNVVPGVSIERDETGKPERASLANAIGLFLKNQL